jgi:hypothetical protein
MGAARNFNKGVDKARIALGTPGLFRLQPGCVPQAYAVQLRGDKALQSGEKVSARLDGQNVLAMRGFEPVGVFKNPRAAVISATASELALCADRRRGSRRFRGRSRRRERAIACGRGNWRAFARRRAFSQLVQKRIEGDEVL